MANSAFKAHFGKEMLRLMSAAAASVRLITLGRGLGFALAIMVSGDGFKARDEESS